MQIDAGPLPDSAQPPHKLFDLADDPQQMNPLQDDALESQIIELLKTTMSFHQAPPEAFARLGYHEQVKQC